MNKNAFMLVTFFFTLTDKVKISTNKKENNMSIIDF